MEHASGTPNFALTPGSELTLHLLGTKQVFKAQAGQTGGELVCAEFTLPPGTGLPPHRHAHEDEAFYVTAGTLAFTGDDTGEVRLTEGGFFYAPRGCAHSFRSVGDVDAKLLGMAVPGANIGAMYAELASLVGDPKATVDAGKVAEVCGRYGIEFLPG